MKKYFILFCLFLGNNCYALANELNLYIWSEYLPENIIERFTKETGIKVNLSTYDSNESLYTKIKLLHNSKSGYDLAVPSTYRHWQLSRARSAPHARHRPVGRNP